jgi:hypothetical protein
VPDNRQTSKQRRAARNRAYREAMAARRENAATEARERATSSTSSSSSGASGGSGASARGGTAARAGGGRPSGIAGALFGRANGVGDLAVLFALLFALGATVLSLYVAFSSNSVPIDHNGDAVSAWPAVSRQAYAVMHDTEPVTETTTLVDAYGPVIPIFALLPALVAAGAFVTHRRQPRSRPLTYALVAMALVSVFNLFAMYFLPALIALAFAGFQVRKTEAPAPRGGGLFGGGARPQRQQAEEDDDVIDVDEVDPDEDEYEDDLEEDEYEDEDVVDEDVVDEDEEDVDEDEEAERPADRDEAGDDVLAELEDEIETEGDEPDQAGRGRRSGRRSSGR